MGAPKVVIVGGGPGGIHCATSLRGVADVTLIDDKDFYELVPGSVRGPVQPNLVDRFCMLFTSLPNLGTFIHSKAVDVTKDAVVLEGGKSVSYDHLVIATGSSYPDVVLKGGKHLQDKKRLLKENSDALAKSKSVLIIGGGPVGVEVAAEIAVALPGKDITLVTSAPRLIETKPPRIGAVALDFLKKNNVKVVLKQKASKGADGKYVLSPSGEALQADVVYTCIAGKPHSEWLRKHPAVLDQGGYVKVDSCFRVQDAPASWFAVGDVSNLPGVKLLYLAGMQGDLLASNLKALIQKGPDAKLKPWTKNGFGVEAMFISLGPKAGTGHLACLLFPSFLAAAIKSGDLFIGKGRSEVGASPA
eukprot:jgi/Botrbrau1/1245/Bobra.0163s0038.1